MNKASMSLIGNVAADAILIAGKTEDGKVTLQPRLTFTIIVNHYWQESGKGRTPYPCTLWGPLAEKLAPSIIKGKLLSVDGMPTLYDCGGVIPGTEKTVRGFNCRVDKVYLGPNSKKSQEGTITDPTMLAVMTAVAEASGINIDDIIKEQAAKNAQASNASENTDNTEGEGDSDTPFGDSDETSDHSEA